MKRIPNVINLLKSKGPEKTFELARRTARDYVYCLRERGEISFSEPKDGDIPSIHIVRRTLPEVWETTTMALLGVGQLVHTHYDPGHKSGEYKSFPSLEASVMMHIEEPRGEPGLHMNFLGGCMGFGDYWAEMEGVKDHWILNPEVVIDMLKNNRFGKIEDHKGWLYSYSSRFRSYPYLDIEGNPQVINQLQQVVDNLTREPLSRSAQCITWDPRWDHNDGQMHSKNREKAEFEDYHAPCLQRVWFRLVPFGEGYRLNVNADWRSRDHVRAVPHNVFGLIEGMVEPVRAQLEKALKVPVALGRYIDGNDSLHIYGHYLDSGSQGKSAEFLLQDVFRIAGGEPIEKRLILPGTPIHDMTLENIKEEYERRKANPDLGRN